MDKKLYRSTRDRKLAGVCGGIAEYFNIDVTLVRLVWIAAVFIGGTGLLLYILAAIVIPENTGFYHQNTAFNDQDGESRGSGHLSIDIKNNTAIVLGLILIFIGGFSLLRRIIPSFWWNMLRTNLWPGLLVVLGIVIIISAFSKKQ